ncbi:hypothetical protein GCM10010405_23580 [Streptomyces macrosporus]|uniref:Uncharacterized protein n=1 Tax=Streptomyces macrosporus TaxID=44032 RepID=A0ABN3JT66_9ACTN
MHCPEAEISHQEVYFRDGGRRTPGLVVEFIDIGYIEIGY